jgi:pimeloyl-ACP methyl ester carboxylesterase
MTTFVLVPGAWLGAWCWSEVADHLTGAGHDVHSLTLPGLAERAGEAPASSINLSAHVADVLAVLKDSDLRDATLVAHSYAGALADTVADRAAERLGRVIYLATQPLPDGRSVFDVLGPEAEQSVRDVAVAAGDPDGFQVLSDEQLDLFYPGHGLGGDLLARFRRNATPHPIASLAERVALTGDGAAVPRAMIWCAHDGPAPGEADRLSWAYRELDAGHWPMLTAPELLAETLAGVTSA